MSDKTLLPAGIVRALETIDQSLKLMDGPKLGDYLAAQKEAHDVIKRYIELISKPDQLPAPEPEYPLCEVGCVMTKQGENFSFTPYQKQVMPEPMPDVVETLAFILAGPNCQDVDDQFSKHVISKLSAQGYAIVRRTMSDAELMREGDIIASPYVSNGQDEIELSKKIGKLAKRYAGEVG